MQKWSVLLVGGPNGTGKTTIAGKLSRAFKIPFMTLDDIRVAMQTVATEDNFPGFNSFFESWPDVLLKEDSKVLVKRYFLVAEYVWRGLDFIIRNHINNRQPVIIEGDLVIPHLINGLDKEEVEAVFLHDSRENIYQRGLSADFATLQLKLYKKFTDFNYELGQEVAMEAEKLRLKVISSSPIASLYQRVVSTL